MVSRTATIAKACGTGDHDLATLSAEINAEHDAATLKATEAIEHARRCGELLIEAKGKVKHGQWLPWLEAHCSVSPRQSQKYMRIHKNWAAIESKSEPGSYLALNESLRLVGPTSEMSDQPIRTIREAQQYVDRIGMDGRWMDNGVAVFTPVCEFIFATIKNADPELLVACIRVMDHVMYLVGDWWLHMAEIGDGHVDRLEEMAAELESTGQPSEEIYKMRRQMLKAAKSSRRSAYSLSADHFVDRPNQQWAYRHKKNRI